jgi:predicted regulator of Ras-like GTPase activity (Roadblock/LC7/MglB family)
MPATAAPAPIPMPVAAAPAPIPMQAAPAPAPVPQAPEVPPLVVPLAALADGWPDAVRKEIVQANLSESKVALPCDAVERGLKLGRIAFSWKTIRSWIKPAPEASVSPHDGAVIELPLKVVAPLFLNRQRENNKPQQKVEVDHTIPNLFFGFPQPDSPPAAPVASPAPMQSTIAPPNRSQDTNYYSWEDRRSDSTRFLAPTPGKPEPAPGTKFTSKNATPNEVVTKAATMDGVAGALIALPDGLMVASKLPPELNGDTLAAFLPQIFSKISQCTKELRMGELNNVNFTVGNVPWKIFRVNAIFFAAFGRTGEAMPTAQLAQLAAELDHKPK